jgi:hypothetical protein
LYLLKKGRRVLADAIIRWTARLFVACYFGRLCVDAIVPHDASSYRIARWLWTCGCAIYFVHVAAAFHWMHQWSHAAAYEHVLARTTEMTGFASGIGLYVNYAFGALWLADTVIWWLDPKWPDRIAPHYFVQAIFAFLMFQATAVFGPSFWKPVAAAVIALLLVLRRFAVKTPDRVGDNPA